MFSDTSSPSSGEFSPVSRYNETFDELATSDFDSDLEKTYKSRQRRKTSNLSSKIWTITGVIFALTLVFLLGYHAGSSSAYERSPVVQNVNQSSTTSSSDTEGWGGLTVQGGFEPPIEEEDRPLITYAYHETPNARENALFFINHGLHAYADFIFLLNGETDIAWQIPSGPNIKIIQRNNTCFDLGAHAEILTADNNTLIYKYKKFIMMNASIRGPFLPTWSKECWSDAYLDRVVDNTKLVGMTMRCNADGGERKVMQSMLFATDRAGLMTLLPVINHCFENFGDAVGAEEHAAQAVINAGYNISVMMTSFTSHSDYASSCNHGEVLGPGAYFGTDLHPYEMIFQKANRDIAPRTLELFTQWHDQAGYSSWDACWKKRMEKKKARWSRA